MKKWFVAFLLIAMVTGESCVVRPERRRHPRRPPPPAHGVVVY